MRVLFTWVMIGLFVAFVLGILALGVYSPRSGADVLDWKSVAARGGPGRGGGADARRRQRHPPRGAVRLSAPRTTSVESL